MEASNRSSRLSDRIGLLYDITRTLPELELDVHLAKVATYTNRVVDSFYVRDDAGSKVTDEERVEAVRDRVTSLLR